MVGAQGGAGGVGGKWRAERQIAGPSGLCCGLNEFILKVTESYCRVNTEQRYYLE